MDLSFRDLGVELIVLSRSVLQGLKVDRQCKVPKSSRKGDEHAWYQFLGV